MISKLSMIRRNWYIVDAKNKVLGRLSSMIVRYLNGKHKIEYAPHIDIGDYVVVVNSKRVYVSGQKRDNKIYYCHTGYVGGIKKFSFRQIIERYPERVVEFAVKGMLPKNSLGRIMYRRLKVYPGAQHDHVAQNLQVLSDEVKIG